MAPPMRRHWTTLLAMLAIGAQTGPAASAEAAPDLLSGRGFFSAGMFSNHTDLQIRFDPSSLKAGTEVDWDQRFGLADTHRFRPRACGGSSRVITCAFCTPTTRRRTAHG